MKEVRCNQMRFRAEKIAVPDIQETTEQGDILFSGSLFEMFIHRMGTAEELPEVVKPDVKAHRKADSRPNTVSTSYPRLKPKHVLRINSKLGNLFFVGRQGNEMFGNVSLLFGRLEEPVFCSGSIGSGLGCRKGFACDEKECSSGIGVF